MTTPSPYVARKAFRFGDRTLQIGESVPVEPGRDYRLMLRLGQIAEIPQAAASAPAAPAAPFPEDSAVFFVGEDGAHALATFHLLQDAPEDVRAELELPPGAKVALVTFADDQESTFVLPNSLLPEQPTRRLIEDLSRQEDPLAPATPWQEGSLVVWVNADGAPQLMTFEGLDNPGDVQSARVRPLAEEGQPEPGVQQVRLQDLLPGAPATLLMAFEQNRVAEAAATHAQASEVQLALADKLEGRIAFLELLIKAVRAPGDSIPEDFPATEFLAQNGITTLPGLRLLADGEQGRDNLMALDAIGGGRADKILAALASPPTPEG